jgi:hypothetical protein
VVISLKSKLELASLDFSGIAVSRMSRMRMGFFLNLPLRRAGRGAALAGRDQLPM